MITCLVCLCQGCLKRLVNEEWLCHWYCVGNKADHSISLSFSLSLSCLRFFRSSSFHSLIAPLHRNPSFTAVFHSLIAFCLPGINEVLVFANLSNSFTVFTPHSHMHTTALCNSWRCASKHR